MRTGGGRKPQLTVGAVRFLRRRRAERMAGNRKSGIPDSKLCARWGITRTAMFQAATGITYKWIRP